MLLLGDPVTEGGGVDIATGAAGGAGEGPVAGHADQLSTISERTTAVAFAGVLTGQLAGEDMGRGRVTVPEVPVSPIGEIYRQQLRAGFGRAGVDATVPQGMQHGRVLLPGILDDGVGDGDRCLGNGRGKVQQGHIRGVRGVAITQIGQQVDVILRVHQHLVDLAAKVRTAEITHPDGHFHGAGLGLGDAVRCGEYPLLVDEGAAAEIAPIAVDDFADGHHPAGGCHGAAADDARAASIGLSSQRQQAGECDTAAFEIQHTELLGVIILTRSRVTYYYQVGSVKQKVNCAVVARSVMHVFVRFPFVLECAHF